VVLGCSLFEARDPEPPSQGSSVEHHTPSEPESVLFNMEAAYRAKTAGLSNFREALAETLTFLPSPVDVASLGEARYEDWTREVEVEVTQVIFRDPSELLLEFTRVIPTILSSEEEEYRGMPYHLYFVAASGDTSQRFSGLVDLLMKRNQQGFWAVRRLVDQQDNSGNPTWGNLKGTLRL
jgi:hypothetical protein